MKRIQHMVLNFSSYSAYVKCPRRFAFSSVLGLAPKGGVGDTTTTSLFKGSLVHACINAMHTGRDWRVVFDDAIPANSAMRQLAASRSGSIAHFTALLEKYEERYGKQDAIDFDVIAVEQHLEMPLLPWLTLVGDVDKIVRYPSGAVALMDHKTSSNMTAFLVPSIPVNDQFTCYLALAQANGYDANTLIVDAVSTAHKYLHDPVNLFARYETTRSVEQIEEFKARIKKIASRMREDIESGEFVSHQPDACNLYGRQCEFYNACAVAGQARLNILNNDFEKNGGQVKNFRILWE